MAALPLMNRRTLCRNLRTVNDQPFSCPGRRKRPALALGRRATYDLGVRPRRIRHLPLRGAAGRLGTAMAAVLAVAGTTSGLITGPAGPVSASTASASTASASTGAAQLTATQPTAVSIRVGTLRLRRCGHGPPTYCGHIRVPLDYASAKSPRITVSFRWLPALHHATGTILAVEGGPGFASIGTESDYRAMIGPLLDSRNLLLIDLRGTGTSTPIRCRALEQAGSHQSGKRFNQLVGACGRQLNHQWRYRSGGWVHASDDFNTAYSARDADWVLQALRLTGVDLYGDSYGSWFAQTFASRYPARLRSVTLDSTYQVLGLDPWYTTSVITARRAFTAACRRWPACTAAAKGQAWARISALARRLARNPVSGQTTTADGTPGRLTVTVVTLVNLINNAGFDPVVYRNLDAAARALLRGHDPAPLLRIAALSLGFDDTNYPFPEFSDGLYFAVACTDYVQLFSRTAPTAQRATQYRTALRREPARTFAPFSPAQWTALDQYTESYSGCLHWPSPARLHPPITRRPPLVPPRLPVLVLSGTLDSLTPKLGGATLVTRQVGPSARLVTLANLTHVAGHAGRLLRWADHPGAHRGGRPPPAGRRRARHRHRRQHRHSPCAARRHRRPGQRGR
jgi:pimeloyl-ACP methyl ester carboxylesterase